MSHEHTNPLDLGGKKQTVISMLKSIGTAHECHKWYITHYRLFAFYSCIYGKGRQWERVTVQIDESKQRVCALQSSCWPRKHTTIKQHCPMV